jgi:hypothetical protein
MVSKTRTRKSVINFKMKTNKLNTVNSISAPFQKKVAASVIETAIFFSKNR